MSARAAYIGRYSSWDSGEQAPEAAGEGQGVLVAVVFSQPFFFRCHLPARAHELINLGNGRKKCEETLKEGKETHDLAVQRPPSW